MPGTLELNMVSEHIIDSKETKVCNGLKSQGMCAPLLLYRR